MTDPSGQLDPGAVVARRFRVVRLLGRGGMGEVYEAEHLATNRRRALKLMRPGFALDARAVTRFAQEARAGARIESEHIVEVVDAGVDEDTGTPWLAMELLQGEELRRFVERKGALSRAEALEVFRQLCHALAEAHRAGLVHRDLKPENVFVATARREGVPFTVKLLDLGLARWIEESRSDRLTTGAVGSPLWMAPEQTERGGRVTPAADVWALGLLVFWALTGASYWRAAREHSLQKLLVEILVDPLPPPSERAALVAPGATLPAGFDAWFARCVARDPTWRFADAGEALLGLSATLAPLVPPAGPSFPALPPLYTPPPPGFVPSTQALPAPPTALPPVPSPSPSPTADGRLPRWAPLALAAAAVATVGFVLLSSASMLEHLRDDDDDEPPAPAAAPASSAGDAGFVPRAAGRRVSRYEAADLHCLEEWSQPRAFLVTPRTTSAAGVAAEARAAGCAGGGVLHESDVWCCP